MSRAQVLHVVTRVLESGGGSVRVTLRTFGSMS
jgi:hypothetical protein